MISDNFILMIFENFILMIFEGKIALCKAGLLLLGLLLTSADIGFKLNTMYCKY